MNKVFFQLTINFDGGGNTVTSYFQYSAERPLFNYRVAMRVLDQSGPISMKLLISRVPRIAGNSLCDEKRIARVSLEAEDRIGWLFTERGRK